MRRPLYQLRAARASSSGWGLLFGLSLLARYEPVAWQKALDPDGSPLAVELEELLDEALEVMPELLAEAITGQPDLRPARG